MCDLFAITLRKVDNFSLKAKYLKIKSDGDYILMRFPFLLISFLFLLSCLELKAQVEKPLKAPAGQLPTAKDTISNKPPLDSLSNPSDSVKQKADSLKNKPKGDIKTTIHYSARDSINSSLDKKMVHLYGDAKVVYGQIELQAEEIVIDYEQSTISAIGTTDSTGRRVGFPVFKDGGQTYETKNMVYNFKTKKAKISEVVTKQGDGFLHGEAVFKNEKNELFSIGNAYTTCNLAHPHFRIIAKKTKAIPGDKLVTGPFYMQFNDVPTPFGFLFGIFPSQRKSASGIIVPVYGEERRRGFFLRRGGYFFDISEYMKLSITTDLYSKGSSALNINSNYNKRYHYTGSLNFSYTNNVSTDQIEAPSKSKDFYLTWSHTPQTKGTGRFSASVTAATGTYTNNNFVGLNANLQSARFDQVTRKMSSNISYSKTFPGTPFSLGINMRHNQDLITKQVDLPLPDVSFNVNNLYPFKQVQSSLFLQNLNVRYSMTGTNQITNNLGRIAKDKSGNAIDSIAPFNFQNLPTFIKNSKKGIRHSIPLSTSFKLLKFFTVSPSFNYDEIWYFNRLNWTFDPVKSIPVVKDTVQQFNRVSNYSGGVGITTRIYGTYLFKNKNSRIKAIRHVINPSASIGFNPDFSDPKYGYYQRFDVSNPTTGVTTYLKSVHEGFIYGSSKSGKSASIGFSVNNNLEMKVRSAKDTVDKKIALFNTLSIGGGYNLLADSFKLSTLALSANSNVLNNKINLNLSATLDPYEYRSVPAGVNSSDQPIFKEKRFDRYTWSDGKIGRITSANFAFSTNLNPKGQKSDNETRDKISKSNASDADKRVLLQNPDLYIDFDIPWNLRISYNADYQHQVNQKPKVTQAIRFSGDISLSEKWKVTYNSGYDFQNKQFTQTQFSLNRELHCWQMSLNWTPFGRFQNFFFSIGVKSALLRDLKLDRTRAFQDSN